MSNLEFYYKMAYCRASDESQVHWHREEIPRLLKDAVEALGGSGNALDIGCGTGVNSVFMADHGFHVTALDFAPEALTFAIKRAEKAGVEVDFKAADVTKFETAEKFDLILDSGCFHGFNDRSRLVYRDRLLKWLSVGGQYVLIHFGKRHTIGPGFIGPRARTKEKVERFFGPDLVLEDFHPETGGKPLFHYRFRRTAEYLNRAKWKSGKH